MSRNFAERVTALETRFEEMRGDIAKMDGKLDRLIEKDQQFAGALKLAGLARWIIAGMVSIAGMVGLSKIAGWLSQLAK